MDYVEKLYEEGKKFEKDKSLEDRKAKGVFYTPHEIVEYMVKKNVDAIDIVKNPYVKIVDLSCGAGYFLLKVFEVLKQSFEMRYEEIMTVHPELKDRLRYDGIGRFIVENNIWGADIDLGAVELVRALLNKAAGCACNSHILCMDSLLPEDSFWKQEFDCVVGNPPYIGHKGVPNEYKTLLYQKYGLVYRDKSDISYCFFQRGLELLKPGGSLCFITSRYFMEGPSAERLRRYLAAYDIQEIVDFGDSKVFADAGIAVCIISIRKGQPGESICIKKINDWNEYSESEQIASADSFAIEKDFLREEGWLLLEPGTLALFRWMERNSSHSLEEIFESHQGIITGCDKAFVMSNEQAAQLGIEEELLKPWIKNSDVDKFLIKPSDKLLIYTDLISEPNEYPNAIAFVEAHKERLQQRRECQRGVRRWYQLQWGRNIKSFEAAKLVYPYKASTNRFAVDRQGMLCSADVYSLVLKEAFQGRFSLEYIAALLNSKAMEFYFKCFAKKISPEFYDYYPNKVLKIKIKLDEISDEIEGLVKLLYQTQNPADRKCILQAIDREIYKMYNLNEFQIAVIENSAGE